MPLKYYLSPKACQGILRRAEKRGKELPESLKQALEKQSETPIDDILKNTVLIDCSKVYRICSYMSNCMKSNNPNSGVYETDINATLDLNGGNPACNQGGMCIVEGCILNDQGGESINIEKDNTSPTLRAQANSHEPIICYGFDTYCQATNLDLMHTLKTSPGGDSIPKVFVPIVPENCLNDTRINNDDVVITINTIKMRHPECAIGEDIVDTLLATDYKGVQCAVLPCVYDARGNGDGTIVPTITGDHNNRVTDYTACYCVPMYSIDRTSFNQGINAKYYININDSGLSQTIVAKAPNAIGTPIVFQGQNSPNAGLSISNAVAPTEQCTKVSNVTIPIYFLKIRSDCESRGESVLWQTDKSVVMSCTNDRYMFVAIKEDNISYVVRRLTPRECAKLQGFPTDWHENVMNAKGKLLPDSAAYKGYGNAVATVCAEYPIKGIVSVLNNMLQ